jgi:hypothetical protein
LVVRVPVKAAVLSDIDHRFAAKRPPNDAHCSETFNRDDVSLVSLRETPITGGITH